jgi:fibronectin-binding autotransporter adhesin
MALDLTKLTLLGGGNGYSTWHYRSTDALSTITAAGYFTGDGPNMLGARDMLTIEADGSGGTYMVENNGTKVSLTRLTQENVFDRNKVYLSMEVDQVDLLAGTSHFVLTPVAGYVSRLTTIVRSAVTTGGTLTVELGGSAIEGLSNVVADGAAAGTIVTDIPNNPFHDAAVVGNRVEARGGIELVGDSTFASAGQVTQVVEITPDEPSGMNVFLSRYVNQIDLLAATSHFITTPVAGQIARLSTISTVDVNTGGAVTVELAGTAVSGLSVTVANAGGVGDIDTDTPASEGSSTGTVAAGDDIELVFAAAFATAGTIWCLLEVNPTSDADTKVYMEDYIQQTDLLAGTSHWMVAPCTGHITKVSTTSTVDVTTGGDITVELGGTAIPSLTVTVADAGGVGDNDSGTPTKSADSFNAVSKGDAVEIVGDTDFASAGTLGVLVEFTPT